MLARLFGPTVTLEIGNGRQRFRSPGRLAQALAVCATPSGGRIAALGALNDDKLLHEAHGCRQRAQNVGQALADWLQIDDPFPVLLGEFDTAPVGDDAGWQHILQRLVQLGPEGKPLQRAALQRYLEYLTAVLGLIEMLRSGRQERPGLPSDSDRSLDADTWPHQALNYNLAAVANAHARSNTTENEEFNRMPKGETLEIEFGAHQSLSLLLARHHFVLVSGDPYLLIDEYGNDLHLRAGKNIVGRSAQCDVAVDTTLRAISRRHMIVEADAVGHLRITDISTIGTFLPRGFLDNRLH